MQWIKIRAGHYQARHDGVLYEVSRSPYYSMASGSTEAVGWRSDWTLSRYDEGGTPRPFAGSSARSLAEGKARIERQVG